MRRLELGTGVGRQRERREGMGPEFRGVLVDLEEADLICMGGSVSNVVKMRARARIVQSSKLLPFTFFSVLFYQGQFSG